VKRYAPMLATLTRRPFTDRGWMFEPKWDGIRLLVESDGRDMTLRTRSGRTIDHAAFVEAPAGHPVVLDGELVAFDEQGVPRFGLLQRGVGSIAYMVFDILYDGVEVIDEPLEHRLDRLARLTLPPPFVRSEAIPTEGEALFSAAASNGLEGIVAKRLGSRYRPGVRSPDWLKVAIKRTVRAIVGGFTRGEGSRSSTFGALLVGVPSEAGLRWAGAVGTGFDEPSLIAIRDALDQMQSEQCPFENDTGLPQDATWVVPSLVAAVEYKEWTTAGRLRAPSFKGFTDEPADTWENEGPTTPFS